jgi:hypothetical protein
MTSLREPDVARETYRHLRMFLVALAAFLLIGSIFGLVFFGRFEGSISANYLGPLRDVFVGSFVGIAVCLVAYRGRTLEDFALNLAGFYALFVAFVPTDLRDTLRGIEDPAIREQMVNGIRVSTISVLVAALVLAVAEKLTGNWPGDALGSKPKKAKFFYRMSWPFAVAFVALLLWRIWEGDDFAWVHYAATFLLIISMAVAVACNGWPQAAGEDDLPDQPLYKWIAVGMTVGAVVVFFLARWLFRGYHVAIAEWFEIALFVAFWVRETIGNWDAPPPTRDPQPSVAGSRDDDGAEASA